MDAVPSRSEAVLDDQPTGIRTAGMFREVPPAVGAVRGEDLPLRFLS